ncbi:hypothetical protein [Nostoc sp.]|uniref:hypothetical protein n=1 Tax=Nostoc sp. TaxID=1180 RepID=UPI003593A78E
MPTLSQNHLTVRPISTFSQNCDGAIAQQQQKPTQYSACRRSPNTQTSTEILCYSP